MKLHVRMVVEAIVLSLCVLALSSCSKDPWNNPNPANPKGLVTYQSVISPAPPKHLDPVVSYATDESLFIMQIYEPLLGYHFLKRPYELKPLAAESMPDVTYLDADGNSIALEEGNIAFTRYTLRVRKDEHFQPHPAFAKNASGEPLYLFASAEEGQQYKTVPDFPETGSRPVTANDYAYQIKRLADPVNISPMLSFMSQHIVGMDELSKVLGEVERDGWLNLNDYELKGVEVVDAQTLAITIKKNYPQFVYWLSMHFFAPVAPEVDRFYKNPGFAQRNLTLDWWPVGSGPFMMVKNDPNTEIILERNPNFREDYYPSEGAPGDAEAGFLDDAGKRLPFIDRAVYRLEKETLPLWTKFLQGYYDRSGEVHANTNGFFDQAFVIGPDGLEAAPGLADHGITVSIDVKPSLYYYGFNMRDPVLGGYTDEKRKLRKALQIAFNAEEYINIFYKGNGIVAQSPLPPGIPGHFSGKAGMNPQVYDWVDGKLQRKSIEYAKQLLLEAGYPNGRDARTGEPLKIFIDVQSQAISNPMMNWMDRQFAQIGVQVEYRPADWNRTREKYLTGNTQIFSHGWLADYPDPENFLFLLHSPESPLVCKCDGTNNANYASDEYDEAFRAMRIMPPGPERRVEIAKMVKLFQDDAVWLYAFTPKEIYLNNAWVYNTKRHGIDKGTLKYIRLDTEMRARKQAEWNQPVTWPLYAGALLIFALLVPGFAAYRRRQHATAR
ncbi:MAG: oligopeptide transport system substrate-binding protein [Halioglobus sp.]|jgi:oligopeptide transport system substrate-binding protein